MTPKTQSINGFGENTDNLQDEACSLNISRILRFPGKCLSNYDSFNWCISIYVIHPQEQSIFHSKHCGN